MTLSPRIRKTLLVVHVATSVGWFGAVAGYLVFDIVASTATDPHQARAAFFAMDVLVRYLIVKLAVVSVVVGVVAALTTPWGLLRHYWVLAKLALTLIATAVLLIEAPTVARLARTAATDADPAGLPGTLPHSIGGLAVLGLILAISVFKPRGVTRYGWRARRSASRADPRPSTAHTGQPSV